MRDDLRKESGMQTSGEGAGGSNKREIGGGAAVVEGRVTHAKEEGNGCINEGAKSRKKGWMDRGRT